MDHTMEDMLHTSHTNYTPRSRGKQQFSLGGVTCISAEEDADIDGLDELLHQTWNVFGVSTLFNFHLDEVHLKQYAKRLREELANNLAQENVTYSAQFSVMDNITSRPSSLDPLPIKINVYAKNNSYETAVEKNIYNGILLSWRTSKGELTVANSIRLPLLLCRGTRNTMRTVHNVLNLMFDCIIIALPAQEHDLIWLVPIIITPTSKEEYPKRTDEICMVYKIPEHSDTIAIKCCVLDLIKFLEVIMKDKNDAEISFNLEHIEMFREALYTQIQESSGLQLGLCTLYKIHLPVLTIMENKMKVMTTDAMNRVLLYLNEKAVDTFHTLNFETHVV
ncbi:uncharacterized protein LOC100884034 [Megachile rotundata]|uniref:uncharacterized protein LOC100884034 n=1 Tax=Megachile rotundata TaxID=143995 RepID=UPI000614A947|nr:PREDICTED: uncharacterized protein LOC100884034 [Megachile rotundata]